MIVILGVVLAVGIFAWVLWMLLTRRLREKYAILWLILALALIVLGCFPVVLHAATAALGVQLPVNLLFATAIIILVGITLHQSWELSQAEDEARRLAEEVAILSARVDRLESSSSALAEPQPPLD